MIRAMPTRIRSQARWCAAIAAAVAAVITWSGCAGSNRPQVATEPDTELITPVVRGVEAGLEARLWVVENRAGVLAGALREFAPPASASPAEIDAWQRHGFRVIEVPLDRLEGVLALLPTIGPRHREWMGLLPEWVEVVKGAQLAAEQPVKMDGGVARLGPGRLRLVTRCWAAPRVGAGAAGPGAVLRVEVMPELTGPRAGEDDALAKLLDPTITPKRGVRGIAFDRLRLGVEATGQSALLIVPEDPALDWDADADGRPESGLDPEAARAAIGPRMRATPTLGELMLTSLALPESAGDARVVVVLVPRVPDRFSLLPG